MSSAGSGTPTKVLSIVGAGRSGTTVLAAVLGEGLGRFDAGEVRWLWNRSLQEQRPCGCGLPLSRCPIWSRVIQGVLGVAPDDQTTSLAAAVDIVAAERELTLRHNRLRLLRSADGRHTDWSALRLVRAVTSDLYSRLVDVTGAGVVIDSSKRPADAAVLAALPSIDHYVLHLVRDPRAVVDSWGRAKPAVDGTTVMLPMRPAKIALRWMESNGSAELLRRQLPHDRWLFMRYEDFAAQPRTSVETILGFMNEGVATPFANADTVVLGGNHTVAGNPDRFRSGSVTIVSDEKWRRRMPRHRQLATAAASLPLLHRYGYPITGVRSS